jgi:hypothetical protein
LVYVLYISSRYKRTKIKESEQKVILLFLWGYSNTTTQKSISDLFLLDSSVEPEDRKHTAIMEDLHEAALAYYNNAPRDLQRLAWNFYLALDRDGDGQVSYSEYVQFLQQSYGWIRPNFFMDLDRNGDGSLDFWEVLTLYYVVKTRGSVWCQGCQSCLVGLYFTCVTCFDSGSRSYDMCPGCYKRRRFSHQHSYFLDNHVMLRAKRGLPPGFTNINLVRPS